MDERIVTSEKCWIGIELNELVENLQRLTDFRGKIWKSNQKVLKDETSWKTWKCNQNSVLNKEWVQSVMMTEELVQNGVMNEQFVKNFVLNAKIDPKVVMDLSVFLNWWMEHFCNLSIQNCWKTLLMRMNIG